MEQNKIQMFPALGTNFSIKYGRNREYSVFYPPKKLKLLLFTPATENGMIEAV